MLLRKMMLRLLALSSGILCASVLMTTTADALTLTQVQGNVTAGVVNIGKILEDLALIAGIGFIFASFFKFHQHKMNPTQVPMSQGVTLLLVGAGLAVFPELLGVATQAVFATGVDKAGGSGIVSVISS